MSSSQRIEGDRVYCHGCDHRWDRAHGGLQCPACGSEFVEILESESETEFRSNSPPTMPSYPFSSRPPLAQSPSSSHHPFRDHNPWAPDPEEDDITTFEFNTGGGGRGTFQFTSRTYTFGGRNTDMPRDVAAEQLGRNFESMIDNIMGFNQRRPPVMMGGFFQHPPGRTERGFRQQQGPPQDLFSMLFQGAGQQRNSNQPPSAFDILGAMLNPGNARRGDMVFSQEAFDRIMTQLMEQNNASSAPGPASDAAIASLRKKSVDESMMGSDGKAECSICMDGVEIGQEVTVLPCNHWFHGDCVISWLREHDTCPHCRKSITTSNEASAQPSSPSNSPMTSRRRHSSRRSSSIASPLPAVGEHSDRHTPLFPDAPSGLRDARQRYYVSPRHSDPTADRPPHERRASERSNRSADNGGGGVTGWLRNRLPFSGQ